MRDRSGKLTARNERGLAAQVRKKQLNVAFDETCERSSARPACPDYKNKARNEPWLFLYRDKGTRPNKNRLIRITVLPTKITYSGMKELNQGNDLVNLYGQI